MHLNNTKLQQLKAKYRNKMDSFNFEKVLSDEEGAWEWEWHILLPAYHALIQ